MMAGLATSTHFLFQGLKKQIDIICRLAAYLYSDNGNMGEGKKHLLGSRERERERKQIDHGDCTKA